MTRGGWAAILWTAIAAASAGAQSGATEQDSTLDNLRHAAGYTTAPLETLGGITRRGSGPIDVLIIPGWGFGADAFEGFMRDNAARYRMVAVTLPGFAGTAAPAMPAPGTSYAEGTWTRAAEAAIVRVIEREHLRAPIVLGHFIVGTQLALRLALDHPDRIGGIVIVGGEPMRFMPSRRDSSGRTPMSREERTAAIDRFMAPRWFKTVTKRTFDVNNYTPAQYSRDSTRAAALWNGSAGVPMPVMIRYLCEYMAMDLTGEFGRIAVPTRVLVSSFAPEILGDPKQAYVKPLLVDSWDTVRGANPGIAITTVPDSRIFITDDHPEAVREAVDDLARGRGVDDRYLETIKVSDNVYVFKPTIDWTHGNGVAIIGPDGVFFIDTFLQFNYAEEAIRRLRAITGLPVRYVLNTHWHFDHVMGNPVFKHHFPSVAFIGADSTAAFLERLIKPRVAGELEAIKGNMDQLDSDVTTGKTPRGAPIVGSMKAFWNRSLREAHEYEQQYRPEHFVGTDITFSDSLTMHWGGQTLRMFHMAQNAHSKTDVVLWIPETRILITGDLVVGPTPYATYYDSRGMESALQALLALKPAIVIPGHGAVQYDLSYMQLLLRAFTEYRRAATAAAVAHVPERQALDSIAFPDIDTAFTGDDAMKQWAYRSFFKAFLIHYTYQAR